MYEREINNQSKCKVYIYIQDSQSKVDLRINLTRTVWKNDQICFLKSISKQECIPVGYVPSAEVTVCRVGACPGGGLTRGQEPAQRVVPAQGVSARGGGLCIPACTEEDAPYEQND